jgi:hypothetical protein
MSQTPEHLKQELVRVLKNISELSEEITRIVNVFPDYYEDMLRLLTVVANANNLTSLIHEAVAKCRDEGHLLDEDLQSQLDNLLRTQDWVKKNYELATEATQKLSALEDVTLQFYDNPHPDVIFD